MIVDLIKKLTHFLAFLTLRSTLLGIHITRNYHTDHRTYIS